MTRCFDTGTNISSEINTEIKPIEIVSPKEGQEFFALNTNKLVIAYDPRKVLPPFERSYSTNTGKNWIAMKSTTIIGDDIPIQGDTTMQYHVMTWIPAQELNPPQGKILIKVNGYAGTSGIKYIVKNIDIK